MSGIPQAPGGSKDASPDDLLNVDVRVANSKWIMNSIVQRHNIAPVNIVPQCGLSLMGTDSSYLFTDMLFEYLQGHSYANFDIFICQLVGRAKMIISD